MTPPPPCGPDSEARGKHTGNPCHEREEMIAEAFKLLFTENDSLVEQLKDPSQRSEGENVSDLALEEIVVHLERSHQAGNEFRERLEALKIKKAQEQDDFCDFSLEQADLCHACQKAQNELDAVKEERRHVENGLCEAVAKVDALLLEREEDEERDASSRVPHQHYESLLKNVTGVQFYDQLPDGKIQGHLAHGGNVKVFDFDKTKNSKFFVANSLWETVLLMNK